MADMIDSFIRQLDDIIEFYHRSPSSSAQSQAYVITSAVAAIERIAGHDSVYAKQANHYVERYGSTQYVLPAHLMGVVEALRNDVSGGFLKSVRELVHGELFSDFLGMADFLLSEGYKDAAAVMGGGVLESHLRQLCIKHGIDLEVTLGDDRRVKKADQLNSDLAKQKVYSLLDQKQVTAWLDLRNKAAHAKYGEYTKEQVVLLLQGVRNFIARCPA